MTALSFICHLGSHASGATHAVHIAMMGGLPALSIVFVRLLARKAPAEVEGTEDRLRQSFGAMPRRSYR